MDSLIGAACADRASTPRRASVPIDWCRVEPSDLPEGSPVRLALERGRYDVAAFLVEEFGGNRVYIQTEAFHRAAVFEDAARAAVDRGASVREAARRFGVPRGRLA